MVVLWFGLGLAGVLPHWVCGLGVLCRLPRHLVGRVGEASTGLELRVVSVRRELDRELFRCVRLELLQACVIVGGHDFCATTFARRLLRRLLVREHGRAFVWCAVVRR